MAPFLTWFVIGAACSLVAWVLASNAESVSPNTEQGLRNTEREIYEKEVKREEELRSLQRDRHEKIMSTLLLQNEQLTEILEEIEVTFEEDLSSPLSEPLTSEISIYDALIKAECALADICEGEFSLGEGNPLEWAERRCAETLKIIRPVMRSHGIRTSEWPPAPPSCGTQQ